ncbi:MAG: formyltransferase family protein [Anaerolineales bacterium]|nr:formyltransferase family protein [Anaerolineales bacterium]
MNIGIIGEEFNYISYSMLLKSLGCEGINIIWFVDARISRKKWEKLYGKSFDYGIIFRALKSLRNIFITNSCKTLCRIHGIPYIIPKDYDINNGLPEQMYAHSESDYILVAGCDQLLNEKGLKLAKQKIINYHYSPLPAYKGKYVMFWQWYNKEPYIGYSFHEIDLGIDTGKVIYQGKVETFGDETLPNTAKRVVDISSKHICEVYNCLMNSESVMLNEEIQASYYPSSMYLDLITISPSKKIQEVLNVYQQTGQVRLQNGLAVRKIVCVNDRRISQCKIEDIGVSVPLMDGHIVICPSERIPFVLFRLLVGRKMIAGLE